MVQTDFFPVIYIITLHGHGKLIVFYFFFMVFYILSIVLFSHLILFNSIKTCDVKLIAIELFVRM